ncbi:MAG: hypothetical protein WBG90_15825 [Saonia sp.]
MDRRILFLSFLAFISGVLYVPFIEANVGNENGITTWIVFPTASMVIVMLSSWIGLKLAEKASVPMSILNKLNKNNPHSNSLPQLTFPLLLGLAISILIVVANQFLQVPKNSGTLTERLLTTPWAAIITETISHLLILSGLYLLIRNKLISILISSFLFIIIFHLNIDLNDRYVVMYLGLANFAASSFTGWVYLKYGLGIAIITHAVMHSVILGFN